MKFEDFLTIEVKDNIAIIRMDHKFETMNVVSPDVIGIMAELYPKIQNDDKILVPRRKSDDLRSGTTSMILPQHSQSSDAFTSSLALRRR